MGKLRPAAAGARPAVAVAILAASPFPAAGRGHDSLVRQTPQEERYIQGVMFRNRLKEQAFGGRLDISHDRHL
jgi:hypothetical protein